MMFSKNEKVFFYFNTKKQVILPKAFDISLSTGFIFLLNKSPPNFLSFSILHD